VAGAEVARSDRGADRGGPDRAVHGRRRPRLARTGRLRVARRVDLGRAFAV